eukprot:TRINITY_DN5392_c0_g1_i8.p1 TRINITY_DN5392_c0_g1~~TRINITY_DN5392_c0_g1_i8.p1  ORF type:complete len:878 (+),score=147.84 TRINITY_DN5392_c0_g1_i8:160-2793(+)
MATNLALQRLTPLAAVLLCSVVSLSAGAFSMPEHCLGMSTKSECVLWQKMLDGIEANRMLKEMGYIHDDGERRGRQLPENEPSSAGNHSGEDASHETHVHPHTALLFMFSTVCFGCFINWFLSRYMPSVPYTVVLYLLGMLMGAMEQVLKDKENPAAFSQSIDMWINIDPHMMLHAFLPALLFGDSLSINRHQLSKCLVSCTLLATLGVLAGAFLTGAIMHSLSPKSLTFYEACSAGSILAATDPVAVVAILNSLGASPKLNMLISGESLMNDGVAIVIYTVFQNLSLGQDYGAGDVITYFLQLFLGGIGLGLGFGIVTYYAIMLASNKMKHDDTLIQTGIMFAAAYLSFWVGEYLEVSGVLCTVVCSMVTGMYAQQMFVSRGLALHVWHFAEFIGNTLLFVLAGTIIGANFASGDAHLRAMEVLWVAPLYLFGIVVRAVVVFGFFPCMARLGDGLTWREASMMVWGGLRGALGLALAVDFAHTRTDKAGEALDSDAIQRRKYILFQIGMFTTLTLVVNAPTAGHLLRKLGIVRTTKAQDQMLRDHEMKLASESRKYYERMAQIENFEGHCKDDIEEYFLAADDCKLHHGQEEDYQRALSRNWLRHPTNMLSDGGENSMRRGVVLRCMEAEYWKMADRGLLPRDSEVLQDLTAAIDQAKDDVKLGLTDWKHLDDHLTFRAKCAACTKYCGATCFKYLMAEMEYLEASEILCYLHAAEASRKQAKEHLGQGNTEVLEELNENIASARTRLAKMDGGQVSLAKTCQLSQAILDFQRRMVEKWLEAGVLTAGEGHHMHEHIEASAARMHSCIWKRWNALIGEVPSNQVVPISLQQATVQKPAPPTVSASIIGQSPAVAVAPEASEAEASTPVLALKPASE